MRRLNISCIMPLLIATRRRISHELPLADPCLFTLTILPLSSPVLDTQLHCLLCLRLLPLLISADANSQEISGKL